MNSSGGTPSPRDRSNDRQLAFYCYEISREIKASRPKSRRTVDARQCYVHHDRDKIFDPTKVYTITFYEISDEEEVKDFTEGSEKHGIPPGRIGVIRSDGTVAICVPPDFLDVLWAAAAADGELRPIALFVQPQNED